MKKQLILLCGFVILASALYTQETTTPTELFPPIAEPKSQTDIRISLHADLGFTAILSHLYRSGDEGSGNRLFDYVKQGGQDNLVLFSRFSVEAIIASQHRIAFLYQPLTLNTKSVAERNGTAPVQISGVAFPAGTPLDLTYGFDFFRLSYLYDFLPELESELGAGLGVQLRNANIVFSSADGALRVAQNNIGLVLTIKLMAAHWFSKYFGLDFEADAFYASSAIFNGAGRPFEGWIWDAALQVKTRILPNVVAYFSIRSIGGGALGSSAYTNVFATSSVPGTQTYNALATLIPSVGISFE